MTINTIALNKKFIDIESFQEKLFYHGKVTLPIITLLLAFFTQNSFHRDFHWLSWFLGVVGFITYWVVLTKSNTMVKDAIFDLAKADKTKTHEILYKESRKPFFVFWNKYGALIAYVLAIVASIAVLFALVIWIVLKNSSNTN